MKTLKNQLVKAAFLSSYLFSILIFFNSCTTSNPPVNGNPPTNEVYINGSAFTPATLTIAMGTTIKWTNKNAANQTVTSDTGLFDSGVIKPNGTYSYTFSTAGTYNYHSTNSPSMTATVVVNSNVVILP